MNFNLNKKEIMKALRLLILFTITSIHAADEAPIHEDQSIHAADEAPINEGQQQQTVPTSPNQATSVLVCPGAPTKKSGPLKPEIAALQRVLFGTPGPLAPTATHIPGQ